MKHFLTLCLLLAAVLTKAQTKPETDGAYYSSSDREAARKAAHGDGAEVAQPFKEANTIIIHTSDSAIVALRKAGRAVVASGYSPTQKDNDLLYLLTAYRPLSQGDMVRIAIRVSVLPERGGSAICFSGTLANAMSDMIVNGATPITAKVQYQRKGSRTWSEVMRVAHACQCGQAVFAYRP